MRLIPRAAGIRARELFLFILFSLFSLFFSLFFILFFILAMAITATLVVPAHLSDPHSTPIAAPAVAESAPSSPPGTSGFLSFFLSFFLGVSWSPRGICLLLFANHAAHTVNSYWGLIPSQNKSKYISFSSLLHIGLHRMLQDVSHCISHSTHFTGREPCKAFRVSFSFYLSRVVFHCSQPNANA